MGHFLEISFVYSVELKIWNFLYRLLVFDFSFWFKGTLALVEQYSIFPIVNPISWHIFKTPNVFRIFDFALNLTKIFENVPSPPPRFSDIWTFTLDCTVLKILDITFCRFWRIQFFCVSWNPRILIVRQNIYWHWHCYIARAKLILVGLWHAVELVVADKGVDFSHEIAWNYNFRTIYRALRLTKMKSSQPILIFVPEKWFLKNQAKV